MKKGKFNSRGQVTIFVIIAVIIIVGVSLFFILRGNLSGPEPGSAEANVHYSTKTPLTTPS